MDQCVSFFLFRQKFFYIVLKIIKVSCFFLPLFRSLYVIRLFLLPYALEIFPGIFLAPHSQTA